MKRLIISEEDRKSILSQHVNEGHTVSESMMGVAFGDEMNGLKIKKKKKPNLLMRKKMMMKSLKNP